MPYFENSALLTKLFSNMIFFSSSLEDGFNQDARQPIIVEYSIV